MRPFYDRTYSKSNPFTVRVSALDESMLFSRGREFPRTNYLNVA